MGNFTFVDEDGMLQPLPFDVDPSDGQPNDRRPLRVRPMHVWTKNIGQSSPYPCDINTLTVTL